MADAKAWLVGLSLKWKIVLAVAAVFVALGVLEKGFLEDRGDDTASATTSTVTQTVTRAPVPAAKRDNTDDRFIALLESKHVPIARDDALMLAIAVCMAYKEHPDTTIQEASWQLTQKYPDWTPDQAGTFIGGAVAGYCPERRNF